MPGPTQEADLRPFECSICQTRFRTKQNRKRHIILIHENAGNFRCSHCDKSFYSRMSMEKHERFHTKERPFQCQICKKRFTTKYHLKDHHLGVHSEKKFKCEVCDKSFGLKKSFRDHLQSHSNERFECDQCGVSYQHRKNFKAHQARHHSATKREAPGRRRLTGVKEEAGLKAVLSDCKNGSTDATYNLRTRRKTANYRDELEGVEFDEENESRSSGNRMDSGDHLQDGVDEASEPNETAGGDDVLAEEPNDRTESGRDISAVPQSLRENDQDANPMIILSSDDEEEDGQDGELAMEMSTSSNVTLKLVYDVEYRAPE